MYPETSDKAEAGTWSRLPMAQLGSLLDSLEELMDSQQELLLTITNALIALSARLDALEQPAGVLQPAAGLQPPMPLPEADDLMEQLEVFDNMN